MTDEANGDETMEAVVVEEFGDADVLTLKATARPAPAAGEVLVRVAFAGVNFAGVYGRRGQFPSLPRPFVPGLEVSGIVSAVGEGVAEVAAGDPVAAFCGGDGYAEYVRVPEARVFRLPSADRDTLLAGSAFPTSVATAWLALSRAARIQQGDTVLVHAAAGALGTMLAQVADHLGAGRVIGTTSTEAKADYALRHGYDDVVLRDGWSDALDARGLRGRIDVAVEGIGGRMLTDTIDALAPMGRVVVIGNTSWSEDAKLTPFDLWIANHGVIGFNVGGLVATRPDV
jgi:NADPH:quinone reductase